MNRNAGAMSPESARKRAEETIVSVKEARRALTDIERALPGGSRPLAVAHTKLEEAVMWLGKELQRINEEFPGLAPNPYPNSRNPESPVIDPPAEEIK